jgi:hypothetical protein
MKISLFDKRSIKFLWQRLIRGFDDSDTWSLDHTIAIFALPRLKRYIEITDGRFHINGLSNDEWLEILNEIKWLFEQYQNGNIYSFDRKLNERADKAVKLFGEYYQYLWW